LSPATVIRRARRQAPAASQGLLALGATGGRTDSQLDHNAVAILHQHALGVTDLASLPAPFLASRASGSVLD
jgi:hypothetical protein